MLREVSELLFEYLISAFPPSRSYNRKAIEQDPMPPLVAHFLNQILQHRLDIEVEHLRTVRTPWFDYEHPDVEISYKAMLTSLAKHSQVPREEWRGTLKRATLQVLKHLILPTHTLVEFVFQNETAALRAPIIYRQINYFAAYPYLGEAVETFLQKRELEEIDRMRFASLLTQIDRHMTDSFDTADWMRMLRPLFDLVQRTPEYRTAGIPIELLSMFFSDKEAFDIQARLQFEREQKGMVTMDEQHLQKVLEGSIEPFQQELTPTEPPTVLRTQPIEEETEPATPRPLWQQYQTDPATGEPVPPPEPAPVADPEAPVPLWMQFQQGQSPAASAAPATQVEPEPNQGAEPTPIAGLPLNDSPLEQLERDVLGPSGSSNRELFVNNLFAGSSDHYQRTLRAIRRTDAWSEASQLIAQEIFRKHQVNIYSPAAVMFTDSVQAQLKRRDG